MNNDMEFAINYINYLLGKNEIFYPQEQEAFRKLIGSLVVWLLLFLVWKVIQLIANIHGGN